MLKNILIIDDHPFFRMGIRTFLEKNFKNCFCVETDSAANTKAALKKIIFNFAFVDISLGDEDGLKLGGFLKIEQPDCKVVVLSMHKEPLLVQKARDLNLDGYLIKEDAFISLQTILNQNIKAGFFLSDKLEQAMIIYGKLESTTNLMSRYNSLTQREQTVFRLLAEGMNYKEIGSYLGVKNKTALVHRYNLMKKMDLADQTELVKCAIKLGLVDSF